MLLFLLFLHHLGLLGYHILHKLLLLTLVIYLKTLLSILSFVVPVFPAISYLKSFSAFAVPPFVTPLSIMLFGRHLGLLLVFPQEEEWFDVVLILFGHTFITCSNISFKNYLTLSVLYLFC